MMQEFIAIGAINDIPVRGARRVLTAHGSIAVFRTADDAVFAIDDECPGKAGPLSEGIVHGRAVTCPIRSWVFSLETGEALGADEGKVRTYPVRNRDGQLAIALPALPAAAE